MSDSGKRHFRLSGAQTILLGFVVLILAGAILLMLPFSSRSGEWTSVTNAFFTATSASCVTGLVLYDTASHWSMVRPARDPLTDPDRRHGRCYYDNSLKQDRRQKARSSGKDNDAGSSLCPEPRRDHQIHQVHLHRICYFRSFGAVAMSPVFISEYGVLKGIWLSVFTSISGIL